MASIFIDLKKNIIDTGLCTRCGGCAASCPVDAISFTNTGMVLTGDCISCGNCVTICPGGGVDLSSHEERLFGSSRRKPLGSPLGIFRKKVDLSAHDINILKRGYFGGRVSAILIHALEAGYIDAALLTDWAGPGNLSIGSAGIARTREDVLGFASSKYVFSPVLSELKELDKDDTIQKAAIVALPCQVHAFRNMELHPGTVRLTRKIEYVIGLNCGASNLSEEKWKRIIEKLTDVEQEDILDFRARKISGTDIHFKVTKKDGLVVEKEMPLNRYLAQINKLDVWPRCMMCPDYSNDLSDITFGMPYIRTEKGERLVDSAIKANALKRSSMGRKVAQFVIDQIMPRRKRIRTKKSIARRKREGRPYPRFR